MALLHLVLVVNLIAIAAVQGQRLIPPVPLREQSTIRQAWIDERVNVIMPALMKENNVSMWILSMREYAEDPIFFSIKSPTTFFARRRTVNTFYFDASGTFGRSDFIDSTDQIWVSLRSLVSRINPATIALNIDENWAFADGLHSGEREILERNLGEYTSRIVRRPSLGVDFLSIRSSGMLPVFKQMMESAWAIIAEGFSAQIVKPGVTTTDDLVWWFRDKIQASNFTTWFQPSVDLTRPGYNGGGVIQKGDMLWCDFGLTAYGLNTDTQHNAYVLKDGETSPPVGLLNALQAANTLQDIVRKQLRVGLTGNEVLAASRAEMTQLGIQGTVYSHPVGDHGHAAGPTIGMWDLQTDIPVRGDARVRTNTWFSVELQASSPVPEWGGQLVNIRQEEDIYIDDNGVNDWVYARQSTFHLVRS